MQWFSTVLYSLSHLSRDFQNSSTNPTQPQSLPGILIRFYSFAILIRLIALPPAPSLSSLIAVFVLVTSSTAALVAVFALDQVCLSVPLCGFTVFDFRNEVLETTT